MHWSRIVLVAGLVCASPWFGTLAAAPLEAPPPDRLLTDEELIGLLDDGVYPGAGEIRKKFERDPDSALEALATHLRNAYAERYFFDWRNAAARFAEYEMQFPEREAQHRKLAAIHRGLYPAHARWKLPFSNLEGNEVTAYELRHLARQHKVLDMAYVHHYDDGDPVPVEYFTAQMRSLNEAFTAGEFEDDEGGNGVYESFRAGYRVLNWQRVHALFLGSDAYGWRDQLDLVRTLLHTGAILHEKNPRFRYGNHQTRGAVALALTAILLRDFRGTAAWYEDAMAILGEHLEKEVNADGFQFERSIHYHVGDIYNYFRVLQLAQLNDFPVPKSWRAKLRAMFEAAVSLARPDRRLPVFQDDTDQPWSESNEMGDFMLLGSILFGDPVFNYFASESAAPSIYWLLRDEQLAGIESLERQPPAIGSTALTDTGYYVMRGGWAPGDHYLAISAGLSDRKPDHQHGDMLGIVARANGQEVLPNYQVRYSLPDYEHFKNSLVKNVAIVDDVLHGRGWTSNRGGSGFGKWAQLPRPEVLAWIPGADWAYFAGRHDGYEDLAVDYARSVLSIDGLGWFVRDRFDSGSGEHRFQQVWQGHYSDEGGGNHHRSTFADGSGLEILQLGARADDALAGSQRGKGRLIYTVQGQSAEYLTFLYPFSVYSDRLPDSFVEEGRAAIRGWAVHAGTARERLASGFESDARFILERDSELFLLGVSQVSRKRDSIEFARPVDLRIAKSSEGDWHATVLAFRSVDYVIDMDPEHIRGQAEPGQALLPWN